REMPYLFAGSAAAAAGGIGLLTVRPDRAVPAARLAVAGAVTELAAGFLMERRLGPAAEPYRTGEPGELMLAARVLTATGASAAPQIPLSNQADQRNPMNAVQADPPAFGGHDPDRTVHSAICSSTPTKCQARTRLYRGGVLEAEGFPVDEISEYLKDPTAVIW